MTTMCTVTKNDMQALGTPITTLKAKGTPLPGPRPALLIGNLFKGALLVIMHRLHEETRYDNSFVSNSIKATNKSLLDRRGDIYSDHPVIRCTRCTC